MGNLQTGDKAMLLLKNGYLLDPASGTEGYRDILIDVSGGRIVKILPQGASVEKGRPSSLPKAIDLNGQFVVPGLVDGPAGSGLERQ